MDSDKRRLLEILLEENNVRLLKRELDRSVDDYIEVNDLINRHAKELGMRLGYTVEDQRFPFQELTFLIECDEMSDFILNSLEEDDYHSLFDYLEGEDGIKRPLIVFEALVKYLDNRGRISDETPLLALTCLRRLHEKRDLSDLVSLLRDAIQDDYFWEGISLILSEQIFDYCEMLDCDFKLVRLLREMGIVVSLDEEQKLLQR